MKGSSVQKPSRKQKSNIPHHSKSSRKQFENYFDQNLNTAQSYTDIKSSKSQRNKKTKGRVKIKMEFIENKIRRYTTFSKRKTGIMKKVIFRNMALLSKPL